MIPNQDFTDRNLELIGRSLNQHKHLETQKKLIEPEIPQVTKPKKIYGQNWAVYNKAQSNEKIMFHEYLSLFQSQLSYPYRCNKTGRPPLQIPEIIKLCASKVFTNHSLRRSNSDITIINSAGLIDKTAHYNTICKYLNSQDITPHLEELNRLIAKEFIGIETIFSPDASGFSTRRYRKWFDFKGKKPKDFVKLHVVIGVESNIIISSRITDTSVGDSTCFEGLIKDVNDMGFKIERVCADAGYLSLKNSEIVGAYGGKPFIKLKKNTSSHIKGSKYHAEHWRNMVMMGKFHPEEFKKGYSVRNNVESTFSAIKSKFLDTLYSKNPIAQKNELLLRILCHNIGIFGRYVLEGKIVPIFCDSDVT